MLTKRGDISHKSTPSDIPVAEKRASLDVLEDHPAQRLAKAVAKHSSPKPVKKG